MKKIVILLLITIVISTVVIRKEAKTISRWISVQFSTHLCDTSFIREKIVNICDFCQNKPFRLAHNDLLDYIKGNICSLKGKSLFGADCKSCICYYPFRLQPFLFAGNGVFEFNLLSWHYSSILYNNVNSPNSDVAGRVWENAWYKTKISAISQSSGLIAFFIGFSDCDQSFALFSHFVKRKVSSISTCFSSVSRYFHLTTLITNEKSIDTKNEERKNLDSKSFPFKFLLLLFLGIVFVYYGWWNFEFGPESWIWLPVVFSGMCFTGYGFLRIFLWIICHYKL